MSSSHGGQSCVYLGEDNTPEYQAAYRKLSMDVARANNEAGKNPVYLFYVKRVVYKKTNRVGLLWGEQLQLLK